MPLPEVVARLFTGTKKLRELDDQISMFIAKLERHLIASGVERVISVKLPDGADLGWSKRRRDRYWRFVIRDGDDVIELRKCSAEERAEALACGAMAKLVTEALNR